MDLNEIKKELYYLNEVNEKYEKLMTYSIQLPIMMILKDKIYYLHQNILTDDLGFIKGRVEDDTILWLNEEDL